MSIGFDFGLAREIVAGPVCKTVNEDEEQH